MERNMVRPFLRIKNATVSLLDELITLNRSSGVLRSLPFA